MKHTKTFVDAIQLVALLSVISQMMMNVSATSTLCYVNLYFIKLDIT